MPAYQSPKDLRGLPLDYIPEGDFILPICTNRERFLLMLEALHYFRSRTADHQNLDHMIDFLEGWAYLGNPGNSPCFPQNETTQESADCVAYPADAPIISYAPQNPFTQPEFVPPGYIRPAFVVIDETDVFEDLIGYESGDVVTGFLGLPVTTAALGQGLARIRVKFKGAGVVELHLLKLVLGGMALITLDDNPLSASTVSLYNDPLQLPPELIRPISFEVEVPEPGEHHIDITFLPRFNDELTFITYGGGLRQVVLCGFDQTIDEVVEERISKGSISLEVEDCMRLRIKPDDPCVIQNECTPGVWEDWYDPRSCIVGFSVQPPPAGELETGDCQEFDIRVDGNGRAILPIPVQAGDTIEISGATGGWSSNPLSWWCPSGQSYTLGACTTMGTPVGGGFPLPDKAIGRLIAEIDGVFYDAFNTVIGIPDTVSGSVDVYLQMNDNDLTNNAGGISVHVKVCRPQVDDTITISYVDGSGASVVRFDQTFVITAAARGSGNYGVTFTASECFDLEIISLTGWNTSIPPNTSDGVLMPCGGSFSVPYTDPLTADYSNLQGFDLTSTTPYTATVKLMRP